MTPLLFNVDKGPLLLDGGLGTELERRGFYLAEDPLWSARLLQDNPNAIRETHLAFFDAGAQCATSNTYQATIPGLTAAGLSVSSAAELIWTAVELANEARDEAQARQRPFSVRELNGSILTTSTSESSRLNEDSPYLNADSGDSVLPKHSVFLEDDNQLKVIRSCGPYGAYLHDGSEYTGIYKDTSDQDIQNLHRTRLDILRRRLPAHDRIVFETIPSKREALLLYELLKEFPDLVGQIWFSFSCQESGNSLCAGDSFRDVVIELLTLDQNSGFISGIGLNCTTPQSALQTIMSLKQLGEECAANIRHEPVTLVAYPNSGEQWNGASRCAMDATAEGSLVPLVPAFLDAGVRAIGGCCRVCPHDIRAIRLQVHRWLQQH